MASCYPATFSCPSLSPPAREDHRMWQGGRRDRGILRSVSSVALKTPSEARTRQLDVSVYHSAVIRVTGRTHGHALKILFVAFQSIV